MPKVPEPILSDIKARGPIAKILEARGVALHAQGRDRVCCCPLPEHDDKTPSFHVTEGGGESVAHCFGCDWAGNVFQLLQHLDGCSFVQAVETAAKAVGVAFDSSRYQPPAVRRAKPGAGCPLDPDADDAALSAQVIGFYENRLLRSDNSCWRYLKTRGLDDMALVRRFSLGFAERGALGRLLPNKQREVGRALRARLEELGWFKAESGHEYFSGRFVVPILDAAGAVVGCYGRSLNTLKNANPHLYQKGGHKGIWNAAAFAPAGAATAEKSVILCEALIDGLTFARHGVDNVTASFGTNGFLPAHLEAFAAAGVKDVFIGYDNDGSAEKQIRKHADLCIEAGMTVFRLALPSGHDVNSMAVQAGADAPGALLESIQNADWLGGARPVAVPELPEEPEYNSPAAAAAETTAAAGVPASPGCLPSAPAAPVADVVLISETEKALVVRIGNRDWRLVNLNAATTLMAIKVGLRVTVGDAFHQDGCDLANHRQRAAFAADAAREVPVQPTLLTADMKKLLLFAENHIEAKAAEAATPTEETNPVDQISAADREAAMAFLRDPQLMERIASDVAACGLVGERVNTLTAYLAATSRRMVRPLAVLVQSSSAAGKTTLMDAILSMMPDEDARRYSALSPKALYYLGENQLKNSILAIAEDTGAEDAAYSLKLLQSDGSLVFAAPTKQGDGTIRTEEVRIDGPIMLFLTTTATTVGDSELENRCVKLTVDEDAAQTAAIHQRQRTADTWEGLTKKHEAAALRQLHQNAQRLLRPVAVVNPYAPRLTFATDRPRLRRDHQKYLDLIKAVTFLHQFQRPSETRTVNGAEIEAVVTTPEDIRLANELAHVVLGRSLDDLAPQPRRLLGLLWDVLHPWAVEAGVPVSRLDWSIRQVLPHLPLGESQVRRHLRCLLDAEWAVSFRHHMAEPMQYRLLADERPSDRSHVCLGLVNPDEIHNYDFPSDDFSGPSDGRLMTVLPSFDGRLRIVKNAENTGKSADSGASAPETPAGGQAGPIAAPIVPKAQPVRVAP